MLVPLSANGGGNSPVYRLGAEHRQFLRALPLTAERRADGLRFAACHAVPEDPLYEYRAPDSPLWMTELSKQPGQPKHGTARACYAICEGGELRLESAEYAVEETVARLRGLPISPEIQAELATVLGTGSTATLR